MQIDPVPIIGVALAGTSLLVSLWHRATDKSAVLAADIAVLKDRTETMWFAWLRRGEVVGETNNLFTKNSPLGPLPRTVKIFAPLLEDLRTYYSSLPPMTDPEVQLKLEKEFGERIAECVCRPNKVHQAAALHAALIVCRLPDDELYALLKE